MGEGRTQEVKNTLQDMEVHDSWKSVYRTTENEVFYELAFDYLASVYGSPDAGEVLDAGCGTGTKTMHLAKRGYSVVAVDISKKILDIASQDCAKNGYQERVTIGWEDLTAMTFRDGSYGRILCWGVLMHVPEIEKAIAELVRVTRQGGTIIVSEANVRSLQAVGMRWIKRLMGRRRAEIRRTDAGIEFWEDTAAGKLVTRQTDMNWIIHAFESQGVILVERHAGQFTEIFTLLPWRPMRLLIHAFNNLWFRYMRYPGPAFGNLLIFRK